MKNNAHDKLYSDQQNIIRIIDDARASYIHILSSDHIHNAIVHEAVFAHFHKAGIYDEILNKHLERKT